MHPLFVRHQFQFTGKKTLVRWRHFCIRIPDYWRKSLVASRVNLLYTASSDFVTRSRRMKNSRTSKSHRHRCVLLLTHVSEWANAWNSIRSQMLYPQGFGKILDRNTFGRLQELHCVHSRAKPFLLITSVLKMHKCFFAPWFVDCWSRINTYVHLIKMFTINILVSSDEQFAYTYYTSYVFCQLPM